MSKLVYAFAISAVSGLTAFAASGSAAPVTGGLAVGGAVPLVETRGLVQKVRCTKKGWSDRKACDNADYGYDYDYYGDNYYDDYSYRRPYYRYQRRYYGYDPYHRPSYGYGAGVPFISFGFGSRGWGGWDD